MKKLIFALIPLAAMLSAQAALIVNGTMDADYNATTGNDIVYGDVGQGWTSKGGSAPYTYSSASWRTNAAHQLEYFGSSDSVGQINAVTTETGSALQFKFDWTPVAGDLTLEYQLVGWQLGATTPAAGDAMFTQMNWGGTGIAAIGGGTAQNLVIGTVTGAADTQGTHTFDIDLSALAVGSQDVSDFDFIGVRFSTINNVSGPGGQLDNVIVAIPEPATFGMLGLGVLMMIFLRRKASK